MGFTETVRVLRRVRTGTDTMGEPIWKWEPEDVERCTVRPLDPKDVAPERSETRPNGYIEGFRIQLPKGYTAPLAHCKVVLIERDSEREYLVEGDRGPVMGSPLIWNRRVEVWRANG